MKIVVNGEEREIEDGATVSRLVSLLDLKSDRLAIELNVRILRKGDWDSTELAEADRVEIVSFVGGGAAGSQRGAAFGLELEPEERCAGFADTFYLLRKDVQLRIDRT